MKSSENYQWLHYLFYYVYILFVFWIVPSQLVNSKHQITFSYYSHVWRGPPVEVRRHWAKAASLLPNIQFRSSGLQKRSFICWDISPVPREFSSICMCVLMCVGTCVCRNVPSAALHSVYGGQMPHWLTVHLMRSADYRQGTMPALLLYFISGALDSSPHTWVTSALPKEPSFQTKTSRMWERLWLLWVEYLRAALLLVFRETSTIMQHKFFQSIWDFNSIWNPAGFITRMNDYKADACKWRDKKIKGHMKFSVCCL